MQDHLVAVPLDKAYRLLNHGPTVLVSAQHNGVSNVMAAAWACALDFMPPKLTVVLDKATATRQLVEGSGAFVVQVPTVGLLEPTHRVGTTSLHQDASKLQHGGIELFHLPECPAPLVLGCSAWLACRLVLEPHNQQTYDLFIGEVIGAWADNRVFRDGRWCFQDAPDDLRSLHYVAGGQFYAIGESLTVEQDS